MTRALVRSGDKTTSGGEVISASSTIIEGRNIALNGDMAWCPKETCNGPFQINGTAYHFAEDKPCVATGDRVLCNCKNNQVLGSTTLWVEDSPEDPFEEHRKRAAEWPVTKMAAAITTIPVFAKSVLRGTGNTDAGTADEPQDNVGEMSFYQSRPSHGCMDEGTALWYNLGQPQSVGLAAPVERLLQQLRAEPVALAPARAEEEE